MSPPLPTLSSFRRIVLKVGSSLVVDPSKGEVRHAWLHAFAQDIAALRNAGKDVLVVASGTVALGRTILKLSHKNLKLEEKQASASVGQTVLARAWAEALGQYGYTIGQVLLTLSDTEERRRYLNARATLGHLLHFGAIPLINENDTVATTELRYGDNDRLAARVATMSSADLLILFSDIDGLYTAPPHQDPHATLLPFVSRVTAEIEAMAGGAASHLSSGGMQTKIEAAKIATTGGTHMIIANGKTLHPLQQIERGGRCTWFLTPSNPITARKKWIAGSLEPRGILMLDTGAVHAIRTGASLLPAGVKRCEGMFSRGDCVALRDEKGNELGRGLISYESTEVVQILGHQSKDIESILGFNGPSELIHRDDMALGLGS